MNIRGVFVSYEGRVRAKVREVSLANKFSFDLLDDDSSLSHYISNENWPRMVLAASAINGDLTDLLDRAADICDRIGDGAEDSNPLALDALQLAGEIRDLLGAKA